MSDPRAAKWRLITAAKLVAVDPGDENISKLLAACFDMPFSEMPPGFLDVPIARATLIGKSVGDLIFGNPDFHPVKS